MIEKVLSVIFVGLHGVEKKNETKCNYISCEDFLCRRDLSGSAALILTCHRSF